MKRLLVVALATACGAAQRPAAPVAQADVELAMAEASRDAARVVLRTPPALRAIGRIGGAPAAEILRGVLDGERDEAARLAAIEALWFTDDPAVAPVVAAAYDGATPAVRRAVARALGRLATTAEEKTLLAALRDEDAGVRAEAAVAVGIMGRRKVEVSAELVSAALENAGHADGAVRYGVALALAWQPLRPGSEALVALAADAEPETRSAAILGLSRRGHRDAAVFARALNDKDIWVRVEAARALSSDKSTPEMRVALASALIDAKDGHVLREGLARLIPFAKEDAVGAAFARWAPDKDAPGCLARAGLVRRDAPLAMLKECGYERHRFLGEAVKAGLGTPAERIAAVEELWGSPEARVRAAAADAAPSLLPEPRAEKVTRAALVAPEAAVAGSAADSLGALADKAPAWAGPLLAERARAVRATDAELFQSFLDALAAVKSPEARVVAEEALADDNPAVRGKAQAVLKEVAPGTAPRSTPAPPRLPPLDVRAVLGRQPVLVVETTRGTFRVELDPELAPWNVSNLVTLAEKGFYDGTLWHRVVPGFVVQGGDPTGTGWGGPGYDVPAEPSSRRYLRGAVGIADAGKDTGGSQWFVMHQKAPHLDGRYTLVGQVAEKDMAVVDALQVGDKMVKVKVER